MKATKGDCKFIPVRLDNCAMPAILLQTLYIDAFVHGFETALRQIVDVASGSNTFRALGDGTLQNVRAYLTGDARKRTLEFRAESYMEPHSRYLVAGEAAIADYALGTHLDAVAISERAAESFGAVRHPRPSNLSASTRS